jgi:hypothetical protein
MSPREAFFGPVEQAPVLFGVVQAGNPRAMTRRTAAFVAGSLRLVLGVAMIAPVLVHHPPGVSKVFRSRRPVHSPRYARK